MDGYQEEGLTYADLNPQTVMLSDGVRSRKTATGYVVEVMGSDEHWHAITGSDWDSDTKFNSGTIVFDRGGQWKARVANTNSRPVSGNTDWELVGGLPYVDVTLDPVALTTAPFYDETGGSGLGLEVIPAPGAGLIAWPLYVDSFPSAGDPWARVAAATLFPFNADGSSAADQTFVIADGLTDTIGDPEESTFFNAFRTHNALVLGFDPWTGLIGSQFTINSIDIINSPWQLVTTNDITDDGGGHGTLWGTRSIRYRIYYQIVPVTSFANTFFHITAIDQGTKTITVNGDASALTGSIEVVGSTGNDGTYTIVSATFDTDHTDIVVSEAVPDDTADGWVKQ